MPAFVPPPQPPRQVKRTEPSQEDLATVEAIVRMLEEAAGGRPVGWLQVVKAASEENLMPEDVAEKAIQVLLDSGALYEPVLGQLRVVPYG